MDMLLFAKMYIIVIKSTVDVDSWGTQLTSLCVSFLIWKVGTI